ncbi:MAG: hypothetical protein GY798_20100 [Hyphomicrobiales bacterium]|nr:hypothetical protein [Hyphomicrobiales bacterium]
MPGRIAVAVLVFFGSAGIASADCVEDYRPVAIGDSEVNVRSYICRSRDVHIKVEFHRLSMAAVSLVLSGESPDAIASVIGAPRIQSNDVAETALKLLDSYAATHETAAWAKLSFDVAVPRGGAASLLGADQNTDIKLLETDSRASWGEFYYPAVDEIKELMKGKKPDNLKKKYYYYWRFLEKEDLARYQSNLSEYNALFANEMKVFKFSETRPKSIKLMIEISEGGLPEDFSVIYGWYDENYRLGDEDGCYMGGWMFYYLPRIPIVDFIVVRNLSERELAISGLLGAQTDGGLRSPRPSGEGPVRVVGDFEAKVQPGDSAAVATKITFAPSDELRDYTSSNYLYGPAYDITGVVANGQRIDFSQRSANFTQLSLLDEEGSCPFLLSERSDGQWIDHGKILHTARGSKNEYQEWLQFDGLRTKFRLEEREPEAAYIDEASLRLVLNDGTELTLQPDRDELVSVDGNRLTLLWGEGVEFSYALPGGIRPESVEKSELSVTGHYVRYPPVMISSKLTETGRATNRDAGRALNSGAVCPFDDNSGRASLSAYSNVPRVTQIGNLSITE